MKYLVCNPPAYLYDNRRHFIQAGSRWSFSMDAEKGNHKWPHYQPYPFSLGYAVSILKEQGHEVDAFDACALDMNEAEFKTRVIASDPNIMFIEVPTVSYPYVMLMLKELKWVMGKHFNIVIKGPHVKALPHEVPYIIGFSDAQYEWEGKLEFKDYPFPDREFFPNKQYSNFDFGKKSAQMLTSKGCKGRCTFCMEQHVMYGRKPLRTRTPNNVVDEIESLDVNHIWFDDMSITDDPTHIEGLCTELIKRDLDVTWSAFTCLNDHIDDGLLTLMSKAKCIGLAFGVETITPEALKNIGKTYITKEKVQDFAKMLRKHEIHSVASYIIGLPGETVRTSRENRYFATGDAGTDSVQFAIATPLPGTPFFKQCEKEGWLITKDWTKYDGSKHSVLNYRTPSDENKSVLDRPLNASDIEDQFKKAMDLRAERNMGFRK